jgi:hypothetical protein
MSITAETNATCVMDPQTGTLTITHHACDTTWTVQAWQFDPATMTGAFSSDAHFCTACESTDSEHSSALDYIVEVAA